MTREHPVQVVEWRHVVEALATRFGDDVYRIVAGITVAASTVHATAATDDLHFQAATVAIQQVSATLHRIAGTTGDLRNSVDQVIRRMIAESRSTRVDGAQGDARDVNQLVQAVFLAREIDSMATDLAGLSNLLAAPLSHVAAPAGSDLPAAAGKIVKLSVLAISASEEIDARLAELQRRVAAALVLVVPEYGPGQYGPVQHAGNDSFQAAVRAA